MYVYKIETSYIEDNFTVASCQCCGNCQLWAPEQKIDYKINVADPDITDTTVTTTPLNLGACIISRRTGKDDQADRHRPARQWPTATDRRRPQRMSLQGLSTAVS